MEPLYLTAFAAIGVVAGLLAGLLGIGGGAVIVPALIVLFTQLGFSDAWVPHQAAATSLATVIATGAASAWTHHRRGAVRWDLFVRLVPWILLGAWLGASIVGWLPAIWLKRLFGLFLLYNAARMFSGRSPKSHGPLPSKRILGAFATVFGALSALLGIGGGILMVPFLVRRGVTMQRAVATSSACGVPMALAGSIGFMLSGWARDGLPPHSIGFVYWPAAIAIMVASMPMATLGARLAHQLPTATLRRIFGLLLLAAGLRLLLA
ncbi:MAG: sulfite exporter TauE/SafE family protein [Thiohalocapsa sp.]